MGSKFSKGKQKNGKNKETKKALNIKDKEKKYAEWNMDNLKYINFNISKIELRAKIFSVGKNKESKLKIFPNGNILIHDDKDIRIFDPKILKPLFTFSFDHLDDVIILSNNSLLLKFFPNNISINTLQIMNFTKEKTELLKKIDIKCGNIIFDKKDVYNKEEYFLYVKKLNNNRILCYYFYKYLKKDKKILEHPDYGQRYFDPYYGKTPYKYNFMFYKYNNNDLILQYKDSHTLTYFRHNILPYEDSFFIYGNSSYANYSNPIVDLCFLNFYKNKKIKCIMDGYQGNEIEDCIIFKKKYLIILYFRTQIDKYFISDKDIIFISEYNSDYYINSLMKNRFNLISFEMERKEDKYLYLYFSELDENLRKIKEDRIILTDLDFKDISFYNNKLYILSNNCNIYY